MLLPAMRRWFRSQEEIEEQRRCLQALYFLEIDIRESEIQAAHRHTFEWLLTDVDNEEQPDPKSIASTLDDKHERKRGVFLKWLRVHDHHDNVFSIFGKPGAGKSTLMKFIAHHDQVRATLQAWAGNRTLVMAQYFLWTFGKPIQRSLSGMLQSVLFQILRQQRQLMKIAFPEREWLIGGKEFRFSQTQLIGALERVLKVAETCDLCFFFLIDGLDEFNDDKGSKDRNVQKRTLIDVLQNLHAYAGVKLCLSTRPHPSFNSEYGKTEHRWISVQDLTRQDTRIYVDETLEKGRYVSQVSQGRFELRVIRRDYHRQGAEGLQMGLSRLYIPDRGDGAAGSNIPSAKEVGGFARESERLIRPYTIDDRFRVRTVDCPVAHACIIFYLP